jgi:ABC-2 type transport system ATP-binding protein
MIEVENLVKHYANVKAVDGVSFSVGKGEIFGLLGPNGAGKTTTIRTIMDIIKPDSGTVRLMGQPMTEASKARIGYLPEERGLYRSFRLLECLTYLGALKGMPRKEASRRATALLEQTGLAEYARRKVQELSKGMTQKAQFVATLVHDPALLILDEPFQGLDPINTEMLKQMLLEEQGRGKTIILSTHDMNQVEEMCNRILLINRGRVVLYGELAEIKAEYAEHAVVLECDRLPETLDGVQQVKQHNHTFEIVLPPQGDVRGPDTAAQAVLRQVVEAGITIRRFEVASAPLEEIFIKVVEATQ